MTISATWETTRNVDRVPPNSMYPNGSDKIPRFRPSSSTLVHHFDYRSSQPEPGSTNSQHLLFCAIVPGGSRNSVEGISDTSPHRIYRYSNSFLTINEKSPRGGEHSQQVLGGGGSGVGEFFGSGIRRKKIYTPPPRCNAVS